MSKKRFIGAIDQGTTSTRFVIFDETGAIAGFDQMEHRQIYPHPGWVEHDPQEIIEKTLKVIVGGFSSAGIEPADLIGIGVTNQRETVVVWDRRTGKPVYNAIVWQDVRTADLCASVNEQHGSFVRDRTGLPVATYFSASKIRWILDNVPGARERAEAGDLLFGTVDSWIVWRLTGGAKGGSHITDATNASRTLLMNLETLEWDKDLLSIWDIPAAMLPEIRSSAEVYGETELLPHATPIAAVLGDQQAALFGQTCFREGSVKNTYGTGCFLLMNVGPTPVRSSNGLLGTVAYRLPGQGPVYGLEGSVAMAGATVQWMRDNLGILTGSAEIETVAASVEDNGGVYFVPAFSGLFAPYWRSDARGIIAGLTRFATKGHIARAALEATAYQTRDLIEAMIRDAGMEINALKVDGGMTVNNLLMQFQADILGIDVILPSVVETTALGAAYAAGLALGLWKDLPTLETLWTEGRVWKPGMDPAKRSHLYGHWKKAVDRSLAWVEPSPEGGAQV